MEIQAPSWTKMSEIEAKLSSLGYSVTKSRAITDPKGRVVLKGASFLHLLYSNDEKIVLLAISQTGTYGKVYVLTQEGSMRSQNDLMPSADLNPPLLVLYDKKYNRIILDVGVSFRMLSGRGDFYTVT